MPKTFSLHQAKTRLSQFVDEAAAGEEIVITKAGVPRARLVTLRDRRQNRRTRHPGRGNGRTWIADDFNALLPPDVLLALLGHK